MFAVVDIETTGGNYKSGKIIEIAVAIFNGKDIVDAFESLINPYCAIPPFITYLTGINQKMVQNAPGFHHIAKKVIEVTAGNIFVAHNVSFDYNYIRQEYKELGYEFKMPRICTLQEARKAFPELRSHGLENLCRDLNIMNVNKHRAMGDVMATVELMKRIMQMKENEYDRGFGFSVK